MTFSPRPPLILVKYLVSNWLYISRPHVTPHVTPHLRPHVRPHVGEGVSLRKKDLMKQLSEALEMKERQKNQQNKVSKTGGLR